MCIWLVVVNQAYQSIHTFWNYFDCESPRIVCKIQCRGLQSCKNGSIASTYTICNRFTGNIFAACSINIFLHGVIEEYIVSSDARHFDQHDQLQMPLAPKLSLYYCQLKIFLLPQLYGNYDVLLLDYFHLINHWRIEVCEVLFGEVQISNFHGMKWKLSQMTWLKICILLCSGSFNFMLGWELFKK